MDGKAWCVARWA